MVERCQSAASEWLKKVASTALALVGQINSGVDIKKYA